MPKKNLFKYGEDKLTAGLAIDISKGKLKGILTENTLLKIQQNKEIVNHIVEHKKTVYGINTGFGELCTTQISKDDTRKLQENLLKSHGVGVGKPIDKEIAKLMMILKVHVLSKGLSGISIQTLKRIIFHIEEDIIPIVPSQGSLGASGDLAPLAHLFLPLIGLGEVIYNQKITPAKVVLKKFNLKPIILEPKEGLALINGTQFMASYAVIILREFHNCLEHADIIAAMMLDAMVGSVKPFLKELHQLRPYQSNIYVADRITEILSNSEILKSHIKCGRVQDPYSLRCIPQVHGASRNAFIHLKQCLEIELNSVTDNPIILDKNNIVNGGNFHGQPIALPLDYAGLAAAELGSIAERRIFLSMDGKVEPIPKLLMKEIGINSGFMILQYTAAALVSENKSLCFPSSADSIPTSLNQEDHVSMGANSARKTLHIITNVEKILAIELICAAQALDFCRPLKSSPIIEECHQYIRNKISHANKDRLFYKDINTAVQLIKKQVLRKITDKFFNTQINRNELFEIY